MINMDLIVQLSQFISVLILIYILFTDIDLRFMKNSNYQLIISFIIICILLFIDPLTGFILSCVAFIVYYKVFIKHLSSKSINKDILTEPIVKSIKKLEDIQSNIYDMDAFNKELDPNITGFNQPTNIQGLNESIPAYDKYNIFYKTFENMI